MVRVRDPDVVGHLLRRYREGARLTQEELAARAGLSVRGLQHLERGERRPYPDTIRRLATALALSPAELDALTAAARATRREKPADQQTLPAPLTALDPLASASPLSISPHRQDTPSPTVAGRERSPRAQSGPALVGRRQELALLEAHLAGEGPPLLLLGGEPGIGKSTLLAEAVRRPTAAVDRLARTGAPPDVRGGRTVSG
jgi:transcriptional regulator with XRE-family HTH domain